MNSESTSAICAVSKNHVQAMSRQFFWLAFLSAICASVLLSALLPRDLVSILTIVAFWTGTAALAWSRWTKFAVGWMGRWAAGIGAILVALLVYSWLGRTDLFLVDDKCGVRAGTFWPLFFAWLAGGGLSGYALLGRLPIRGDIAHLTPRSKIMWGAFLVWSTACAYVFVNNITFDAFIESMRLAGFAVGGPVLVIGGIIGIAMLFAIPERRRQKQAAADYALINETDRQEMLDLIDRHSRQNEFILMYRPVDEDASSPWAACIGGDAAALPGEQWPVNGDGSPAAFMLQLPLSAPRFPSQWQNRIVTVFMVEHGLLVRSYAPSSIPDLISLRNPLGETVVVKQGLQQLAIPYVPVHDGDEEPEAFSSAQLLAQIPELKAKLEQVSKYPVYVLNQIIEGKAQLAAEDAILAGGDPQLIQGEHDALCPVCKQPMRFLFQFGDVTENFELGDCGVGYVYGCDAHPAQCQGFADCC